MPIFGQRHIPGHLDVLFPVASSTCLRSDISLFAITCLLKACRFPKNTVRKRDREIGKGTNRACGTALVMSRRFTSLWRRIFISFSWRIDAYKRRWNSGYVVGHFGSVICFTVVVALHRIFQSDPSPTCGSTLCSSDKLLEFGWFSSESFWKRGFLTWPFVVHFTGLVAIALRTQVQCSPMDEEDAISSIFYM